MKNLLHRRVQPLFFGVLTLALAALGGCRKSAPPVRKAEPQSGSGELRVSGNISAVDEKARTLEVRETPPTQNPNEITKIYRTYRVPMDCKIETDAGGPAQFSDLEVNKPVKVRYKAEKDEFVASKVQLKAAQPGSKER